MCNRILLLFLFIISFLQFGFCQTHDSHRIYNHIQSLKGEFETNPKTLFSTNRTVAIPTNAEQFVHEADYLILEESYVEEIKNKKPITLSLDIPVEGQIQHVQLFKKEVTTQSYQVKASSGAKTRKSKSVFYRGIIKGEKNSFVSLSVLNNSIHMTISDISGNYEINKIDDKLYAAYRVSASKRSQDTGCSSDKLYENENVTIKKESGTRATGGCIEIYIECDFSSYQQNGSNIQNTEDWALAIMNEVGILYENEGVPLVVSDILVYDSPDPYLAGSDTGEMLDIMLVAIGDYDGRLAHVFSTRNVGGGIAWLDVLCANNNGFSGPFAVSGGLSSFTVPFPIYSWNVNVVAHELGHNIGSSHTHDCVWNGNNTQIDDCGSEWGDVQPCYDASSPILPSSGTIMSYCHVVSGIGVNFNNGFGPLPGALLLDKYLSAGCVTGDDCFGSGGLPPEADFAFTQLNPCAPSEVQFTDLSTESPTEYEWVFTGATPNFSSEQNPFVTYNEPGFYDVTLTVTNADGSDELTLTQIIEVLEAPVPDFEYELEGENISFTNQTNASVDFFFWDFGDGNSSNEENPVHSYEVEGTYTVILTVVSNCGSSSVTKSIDVFLPPTADFEVDATSGCTPFTVVYTNASSDNVEAYLWTFDGGTPETSTAENPTVVYEEVGIYDVVLQVTNDIGDDILTKTEYISVKEAPTADFTSTIDGLVVDFENMSTDYETVLWDLGDGNTSTLVSPTHTYDTEGIYVVILSVINSCDSVTMMQSINLNTTPTAGFSVNITEGCAPFTAVFANNSSANTSTWEWNFPGGTPSMSTDENPTVIYNTPGIYDVSLKVTNDMGVDSVMNAGMISVSDVPIADFAFITDDLIVSFIDLSSDYESVSWDFGDGNTSTNENPQYTYDTDGSYEVTLSATNSCGTIEESKTVTVSSLPIANYSASITEGCIPLTVEYSNNSSSNATSWEWSFPGGTPSTSTDENPTVIYSTSGIYDATVIVSSAAGNDTLKIENYISTQDVPTSDFEYTSLSLFEFTFNNTSAGADTYSWDFGDGNASTDENPNHTYTEEGFYEVILSATNGCGTIEKSKTIIISTIPIADYSASITEGCIPLTVEYSNNSSSNVTGWEWSFPGGTPSTSTDENPTVIYSSSGVYDATVIVSSVAGNDTLKTENYISTQDVPTTNFEFTSLSEFEYVFSNTSTGADSYAWDFGDGNESTDKNPNHVFSEVGTYNVVLSATNICGTETYEQEIVIIETSTIDEIDIFTGVSLNPNPNNGDFLLSINVAEAGEVSVEIYNILGQQVKKDRFQLISGQNQRSIQLKNQSAGAYLVLLKKDDQSRIVKFFLY